MPGSAVVSAQTYPSLSLHHCQGQEAAKPGVPSGVTAPNLPKQPGSSHAAAWCLQPPGNHGWLRGALALGKGRANARKRQHTASCWVNVMKGGRNKKMKTPGDVKEKVL